LFIGGPRLARARAVYGAACRMLGAVSSFAVSAIGRDRPGIVAAISRELLGKIEDSQMSIQVTSRCC
jgi:hypothetical protein